MLSFFKSVFLNKKNIYLWIIWIFFIGMIPLLASFAKKNTDIKDENEISVSVWGYDANPEFKALVKGFEKENPGKKVKIIDIDSSNYENKMTIMLAGNDAPDVIGIKTIGSYVNYANRKQLIDLTDSYQKMNGKENLAKNISAYDLEHHYYALPFRREIFVLYYNRALFASKNIDVPKKMTWDQYEALAKKLTTISKEKTIYGSYHEGFYAPAISSIASQTGTNLLETNYSYLKENLKRFIKMQEEGSVLSYASIHLMNTSYSSQFETGKAAMLLMGSFYMGKLLKATNKIDWGIIPIPQMKLTENRTFGGCTGFGVCKESKKKTLAKKFVEYCASEAGAETVASVGMVPAYQSNQAMNRLYSLKDMPVDQQMKDALNPQYNAPEIPADKLTADIDEIFTKEYDLMMVGEESVIKGLQTISKRVKTFIDLDY